MRRLGTLLTCLVGLAALWLLLVDTSSIAEYSACAAAAILATIASGLVSRENVSHLREHHVFLSALPRQLARVPLDLWLLVRELAKALAGRHPSGRFHSIRFAGAGGERDNARRAAIELLGSLAPNTIVLGVDEEQVVVHQLAARASQRTTIGEISP